MTEQTLEKGIKIKSQIDMLRNSKRNLEKHRDLCYGNASEVACRNFKATIHNHGRIESVEVSPNSLMMALDNEIKNIDESLKKCMEELSELN